MRALAVAVLVAGGLPGTVLAAAPQKLIASVFSSVCLDFLPGYEGVEAFLRQQDYEVFSNGGYMEFSLPGASGVWGSIERGEGAGSCSVLHEALSEAEAQQLGLVVLKGVSAQEPMIWKYEGVPSGWVVPYGGRALYVIYSDGGLSAELRSK